MPHFINTGPEPTRSDAAYTPHPAPPVPATAPAETGTIADARARFGLSRSTIYRLAAGGDLRLLKVGRTTLVDYASVRAFLAGAPATGLGASAPNNNVAPRG